MIVSNVSAGLPDVISNITCLSGIHTYLLSGNMHIYPTSIVNRSVTQTSHVRQYVVYCSGNLNNLQALKLFCFFLLSLDV